MLTGHFHQEAKSPLLSAHLAAREREKTAAENFLHVRVWGATLTIKSASGREVKGKEALRGGKKGFHLQGFACVGL